MSSVLIKATGIWLIITVAAIFNGVFREIVLESVISIKMALPISGLLLAAIVLLIAIILIPFIGRFGSSMYLFVGIYWLAITLLFEFAFGYFVAGKSINEIAGVFNIMEGNLFVVVLLVTAISPLVAAKVRGIL